MSVTHLIIVCLGHILGGFIVALSVCMLVATFFPELSHLAARRSP